MRSSEWRKPNSVAFVFLFVVSLPLLAACGGGGGETGAFCEIAQTSTGERNEAEIDQYYQELGAVAPGEIKDDVAVLREGWKQAIFPFEQAAVGEMTDFSRPPEVTEAALNVSGFVEQNCGFEGGLYLVFPEEGF